MLISLTPAQIAQFSTCHYNIFSKWFNIFSKFLVTTSSQILKHTKQSTRSIFLLRCFPFTLPQASVLRMVACQVWWISGILGLLLCPSPECISVCLLFVCFCLSGFHVFAVYPTVCWIVLFGSFLLTVVGKLRFCLSENVSLCLLGVWLDMNFSVTRYFLSESWGHCYILFSSILYCRWKV